jgi:hypothetical protein
MNRKHILVLVLSAAVLSGCATGVQVTHSPLVATSTEQITFTAKSFETTPGADSRKIQILVNAHLVKECDYSPCTYTGGPYGDGYLHYAANVKTQGEFLGFPVNVTQVDGYYHTEITGADYSSSNQYIRGRVRSTSTSTADNTDMVFHMSDDYADDEQDMADFIDDATFKVQDILGSKEILEEELNHLNFWVYKREGSSVQGDCGVVHSLAPSEVSFSDIDAVLHTADFGDCTSGTHFSAEGHNTKAFLHETAHALIDLGDEYDGPTCYSCVGSPEQNIFESEADCQNEQTLKGRDPTACYQFTARDGGWWSIHTGTTVMEWGSMSNPWGIEATERVEWFFSGY